MKDRWKASGIWVSSLGAPCCVPAWRNRAGTHLFAKNFHLNNMSYIIQHTVHCRCKQGRASEVYFLVRNQMSAPATNEIPGLGPCVTGEQAQEWHCRPVGAFCMTAFSAGKYPEQLQQRCYCVSRADGIDHPRCELNAAGLTEPLCLKYFFSLLSLPLHPNWNLDWYFVNTLFLQTCQTESCRNEQDCCAEGCRAGFRCGFLQLAFSLWFYLLWS